MKALPAHELKRPSIYGRPYTNHMPAMRIKMADPVPPMTDAEKAENRRAYRIWAAKAIGKALLRFCLLLTCAILVGMCGLTGIAMEFAGAAGAMLIIDLAFDFYI